MEHVNLARGVDFQPETAPVRGPFVVNLCSSVAPIDLKNGNLPGLERYRLYQVRRVEDNRTRYRLRLGFFVDEAATEAVLGAIRQYYPAALCVPAGSDDLRHAPGFDPALLADATGRHPQPAIPATAQGSAVAAPKAEPAPSAPVAAAPAVKPVPVQKLATAAVPKPAAAQAPSPAVKATALELLPDPAPSRARPVPTASGPFRVRAADPASLESGVLQLKLETDKAADVPLIAAPRLTDAPILLDSTQTLRMLTESELADKEGPQWFALQLAVSDQAINLDTMPKLDIFAAFRLYSVATPQQGRIVHCLRLGFFRERVSAEAVAGYLKTFFSTPDVLRVSAAEQSRFADPPKPPVLQETAAGGAKVVPLSDARLKAGKPLPDVAKPLPVAAKTSAPAVKSPPVKHPPAAPAAKATSKKAPGKRATVRNRSLNDLLHEEAREVALSESGIRRMEEKGSLLSRLVGKFTR